MDLDSSPARERAALRLVPVALAVVLAVLVFAVPAADAQTPGRWIGSTSTKTSRSDGRLITAGYTSQGDFSFTVDGSGRVRGHAVVSYEPYFDTAQLNAVVSFIKTSVTSGLALLGPYAGLAASIGGGAIVGVTVSFDQPMAIREGPIAGSLRGGRLSLDWAGKQPKGIPFTLDFNLVQGRQRITKATIPVDTSWPGSARVQGSMAVATQQPNDKRKGVTVSSSTYWSAHRVSG